MLWSKTEKYSHVHLFFFLYLFYRFWLQEMRNFAVIHIYRIEKPLKSGVLLGHARWAVLTVEQQLIYNFVRDDKPATNP